VSADSLKKKKLFSLFISSKNTFSFWGLSELYGFTSFIYPVKDILGTMCRRKAAGDWLAQIDFL